MKETFPITEEQVKRFENAFKYHAPSDGQREKYEEIRDAAKKFAYLLANMCPPSRELSLAFTELESSVMWANASISRNEINVENK